MESKKKEIVRLTLMQPVRLPLWKALAVVLGILLIAGMSTVFFAVVSAVASALCYIAYRTGKESERTPCGACGDRGFTQVPAPPVEGRPQVMAFVPCPSCEKGRHLSAHLACVSCGTSRGPEGE